MTGVMERTLAILELLSAHAQGLELQTIAHTLNIPPSAVHRLLGDLARCGYVRQQRDMGDYVLTTKLVSLGLGFLGNTGIVDIAQPLIDKLAVTAGELVRLGLIDGDHLTWVASAQGARWGLKYDPDMGSDVPLASTVSGHAYLAALTDDDAMALVGKAGLAKKGQFGPQVPTTMTALLAMVQAARKRGYSMASEVYTPGLNAMAAAVQRKGQPPVGILTIAGPMVRLTPARMKALAPELIAVAADLAQASNASPLFKLRRPAP